MTWLKTWWPTILPILIPMFMGILPKLQVLVAAHPVLTSILTGIGWIIAHLTNSPIASVRARGR